MFFRKVTIDLIGPNIPVSTKGYRYVTTFADYATLYPDAIPLATIDANMVAEAFLEIFCRLGVPQTLLTTTTINSLQA